MHKNTQNAPDETDYLNCLSTMNISSQPSVTASSGKDLDHSKIHDDMVAVTNIVKEFESNHQRSSRPSPCWSQHDQEQQCAWCLDSLSVQNRAKNARRRHTYQHGVFPALAYMQDEEEDSLDLAAHRLDMTHKASREESERRSFCTLQFGKQHEGGDNMIGSGWEYMNDDDDEALPGVDSVIWSPHNYTIDLNDQHDEDLIVDAPIGGTVPAKKWQSHWYVHNCNDNKNEPRAKTAGSREAQQESGNTQHKYCNRSQDKKQISDSDFEL